MFGPIKLTPCAVQRRSTNELVQYRDATASSYPPQSQIPIDPSPLSSDTSNALRSRSQTKQVSVRQELDSK
jgi:hypothetical protein